MGVGFEVPGRMNVKEPLSLETFNEKKLARYTHVGSYQGLEKVHGDIKKEAKAARKNTAWPVFERLLSDPKKVPADQVKTELLVPLS